jgi:hypothetical protein
VLGVTICALVAAVTNGASAVIGGIAWWQVRPSRAFWVALRVGQVAAIAPAAAGGVAAATGRNPAADLFWLYSLLPLAVAFVAEQFRIASAQSVLDTRGLTDAKAMARLPDAEQRSVVLAIVRREIGVMALAAVVAVFLVLRAAATF